MGKEKINWFLPSLGRLLFHGGIIFFHPTCIGIIFHLFHETSQFIAAIIVLAITYLINIAIFVLSITHGWNNPYHITEKGLFFQNKKYYYWSDFGEVSYHSKRLKTEWIIRIKLKKGGSLYLELSKKMVQEVKRKCGDEEFLLKFANIIDDYTQENEWI